jgi:hypothetical protein
MLRVTVANIDQSFHGVFATSDRSEAANAALADLKANHGFFKDNVIIDRMPDGFKPDGNVHGFLMLKADAKDEDERCYAADDENTYWILIEDYKLGRMFS